MKKIFKYNFVIIWFCWKFCGATELHDWQTVLIRFDLCSQWGVKTSPWNRIAEYRRWIHPLHAWLTMNQYHLCINSIGMKILYIIVIRELLQDLRCTSLPIIDVDYTLWVYVHLLHVKLSYISRQKSWIKNVELCEVIHI